jgi:hypothetical protein
MPEDLIEGWTEPIDQALLADGEAPGGTSKTLALELYDRQGGKVDTTGKVAWIDETAGTVRFSPSATDLKVTGSPYKARWKVTSVGKDSYFPNRDADVWTVRK